MIKLVAVLIATQAQPSAASNFIEYRSGGVMGYRSELHLNLDTGQYRLKKTAQPFHKELQESQGTVAGPELVKIRRLSQASIKSGFETDACRKSAGVRILADSMEELSVSTDGQFGSAPPSSSCWNDATISLVKALNDDTQGR